MLFTSITFAFFLPLIFILYWAVPPRYRYIVLFAADILFYMYGGPVYILVLALVALVTYAAGLMIGKDRYAKRYLIGAVIIVIGLLAVFKYADFALGTISSICRAVSISFAPSTLKLALPLGISFYSFAAIGYVIDVYRGRISAERNFIKYFSFVAFFPAVLSGPIMRAGDILPQISKPPAFDYDEAAVGLRQMLWGFFKKLIIADTLAGYADIVFDNARSYFGLTLIVATVFYTFQIYCDFSGYSDIAIGTARLLGIKCMDNFSSPYYSRSDKEFWTRWHISLSSWFRDYVYIPLGGSRVSEARPQSYVNHAFVRSVAWRRLVFCHLGRSSRAISGYRGLLSQASCKEGKQGKKRKGYRKEHTVEYRTWYTYLCHGVLCVELFQGE